MLPWSWNMWSFKHGTTVILVETPSVGQFNGEIRVYLSMASSIKGLEETHWIVIVVFFFLLCNISYVIYIYICILLFIYIYIYVFHFNHMNSMCFWVFVLFIIIDQHVNPSYLEDHQVQMMISFNGCNVGKTMPWTTHLGMVNTPPVCGIGCKWASHFWTLWRKYVLGIADEQRFFVTAIRQTKDVSLDMRSMEKFVGPRICSG